MVDVCRTHGLYCRPGRRFSYNVNEIQAFRDMFPGVAKFLVPVNPLLGAFTGPFQEH